MIDMHMRRHQRLHRTHIKPDLQRIGPIPTVRRRLRPLKQPAIDQQTVRVVDEKLMTGTGHAMKGAVMDDVYGHVVSQSFDKLAWQRMHLGPDRRPPNTRRRDFGVLSCGTSD